jgi:hypothetical protein
VLCLGRLPTTPVIISWLIIINDFKIKFIIESYVEIGNGFILWRLFEDMKMRPCISIMRIFRPSFVIIGFLRKTMYYGINFLLCKQILPPRKFCVNAYGNSGKLSRKKEAVSKHNLCFACRKNVSVPRSETRMRWNPLAVCIQTCLLSAYWRQRKGLSARPSIRLSLR